MATSTSPCISDLLFRERKGMNVWTKEWPEDKAGRHLKIDPRGFIARAVGRQTSEISIANAHCVGIPAMGRGKLSGKPVDSSMHGARRVKTAWERAAHEGRGHERTTTLPLSEK